MRDKEEEKERGREQRDGGYQVRTVSAALCCFVAL